MIWKIIMTKAERMMTPDIMKSKTVWRRVLNWFRHPMVTDVTHTRKQLTKARRLVTKTVYRSQLRTARYRSMLMTIRFPIVPKKHIVKGIAKFVSTISKVCQITSHTSLFIKYFILKPAFIGATVAPPQKITEGQAANHQQSWTKRPDATPQQTNDDYRIGYKTPNA